MTPLRIAVLQGPAGLPSRPAAALAALDGTARRAAAEGARLLVTPELSLTGYALDGARAVARLAQPADGPWARAAGEIAARHGIAVVYGWPERGPAGVHNSVQLIGPDGSRRAVYRKTHLYGAFETAAFVPGTEQLVQTELDGLRLGLLICYDMEFPETVRAHALAGTDLLLVPTALMRPHEAVARTLVPARALESQLYLAYANRCGPEGGHHFTGLSCLAAPDGTVPARAGTGPELLTAEVDPERLRISRAANPYLRDRRPELYGALTRPRR
ncbi:carbon-nitrogen hydrolase family protein [Streptomyces aidingensis]|uniref:Predicted amidohydrolase n=1 Tax=Streptomyces aidingensis TaxID=910347 RepID=A0A1I1P954_9ACTN|nr:carbon-nitrogen hydrolase family protein [Streptomyces aidingensis]SFD06216.1 Predicted amidohydrolase [Streptomyces aidingensis]